MPKKQLALMLFIFANSAYAAETSDFLSLTQECAPTVAPQTMAAIVQTESSFNPWAININAKTKLARQPVSKAEAISTARNLLEQGYNIDLGLGQINSKNLTATGLTVESAFDPCLNLSASASILQSNYEAAFQREKSEQTALHAALSAYNTGSFTKGVKNGYVGKVLKNAGIAAQKPVVPALDTSEAQAQAPIAEHTAYKVKASQDTPVRLSVENTEQVKQGTVFVYGNTANNAMVY
ncbi:conserved exported hypothetical protein [Candidatus Methylobacter favarea]|uniref:Transglycosylase SLT domain-containing protein n=1 Tax=Candidatus Methylobacter favarea TaxID=2707345 RepID=A0A8S0XG31_9GAMM|nr:lytic transglycosylase domain-containing protein [Candidatus Methylobacter favarea]CAA9890777.1 conserved exported hypothetical protein [Candidatus Methylobacter favarea]